jgi:hypothetical protein
MGKWWPFSAGTGTGERRARFAPAPIFPDIDIVGTAPQARRPPRATTFFARASSLERVKGFSLQRVPERETSRLPRLRGRLS